jgi:hypothetical protein
MYRTTAAPVPHHMDFKTSSGTSTTTTGTTSSPVTTVLTTIAENLIASTTAMPEVSSSEATTTTATTTMMTTTTTTTMPLYSTNFESPVTPSSVAKYIVRSLVGEAEDDEPRPEFIGGSLITPGADMTDNTSYADLAIIAAGAIVAFVYINGVVKKVYAHAVYESDPRLIALCHRENSRSTRMWRWTARALEACWIPLWLDHDRLREESFDRALEDTANRTRIRKQFLGSLPSLTHDDMSSERYQKEDDQKRY